MKTYINFQDLDEIRAFCIEAKKAFAARSSDVTYTTSLNPKPNDLIAIRNNVSNSYIKVMRLPNEVFLIDTNKL